MSNVARAKKMDIPATMKPEDRKSTLNINLKKFKSLDEYDIDDDCKLALMGKVTAISKNEWGHDMTIEVKSIDSISDSDEDGE